MLTLSEFFVIYNITTWPWWFFVAFASVIFLGVELLSFIVLNCFTFASIIPVKGKHLDELETIDLIYIYWNRITMVPFMYHAIQVAVFVPNVEKDPSKANWFNVLGALIVFYIVYDFFYHVSD